ncbi:MAG TPA: PTS sugar transporter subunit IIA [Thermoguttaceae bacterium]|nr:PTS sugar transporter subunit IIA [Thermoguttaceae bacterium]
MPHTDFDVDGLAAYLHLTPPQIVRLADRDKLPGRKVSGEWRFSKADIHHWLEDRIGLSDEEKLSEVENVLERSAPDHETREISLAELLSIEAVAVPLQARTRTSVITKMVDLAAETGMLWDPDKLAEAVRQREEMAPTALENGVALLHPRRPMPRILAQPFVALGCTNTGIPFGGRGPMTDIFFLVCSIDDRGHLRTLARLSRVLTQPGLLDGLRDAPDAVAARAMIVNAEKSL